jgi:hypothetical protein
MKKKKVTRLQALIDERGMKKRHAAKVTGFNYDTFTRWCRGDSRLPADVAPYLADFFGVKTDDVIGFCE